MVITGLSDIWATAIQAARVRLNDRVETIAPDSGKLLDLAQPHVQRICGLAWRKFQETLISLKYSGMEEEIVFLGLPPVSTADPLIQVRLSFNGYFPDGQTPNISFLLPTNLIRPYKLWERPTGQTTLLTEMDEIIDGLPAVSKASWNRQWEWRDDNLFMPGATVVTDLRVRYAQYFADPIDSGTTPWFAQPIPIFRPVDALADYICREVEIARQNPDAAIAFQQSGEANARLIVARDTTQAQATQSTAQLNKMRDKYTSLEGAPKTAKR